jgi:hypothetical protein
LLRTWIRRREVLDDALDDGIDDKLVRGSSSFDGAACDLPDLPTLAEAGLPDSKRRAAAGREEIMPGDHANKKPRQAGLFIICR